MGNISCFQFTKCAHNLFLECFNQMYRPFAFNGIKVSWKYPVHPLFKVFVKCVVEFYKTFRCKLLLSFSMAFVDLNRFEHRGKLLHLESLSHIQFFHCALFIQNFLHLSFFSFASSQSFIAGNKYFNLNWMNEKTGNLGIDVI